MRHALAVLALMVLALTPAGAQDEPEKDDLKVKAEAHKKDVTRLRGLEFKTDVKVGAYTKKELLAFVKAVFEKEFPREKALRYQKAYAKFGLIPADLDIYDGLIDLYSDSIAGFYDPTTKELRLIKSGEGDAEAEAMKALGMDTEAITLVHELTHAAQDQQYELSTLPLEDETNDDLILALKAVVEGDASAVGWKYGLGDRFGLMIGLINSGYKSGQLPGKAGRLPAYLRHTLLFPYGYGTEFVLKAGKDFKEYGKLFKDFPLSTEQVLHPEKYYTKRDNPTLVSLPDLPKLFGGTWKETLQNVHGEFAIQLLLSEHKSGLLKAGGIKLAHEGWDGDRYVVLEDGTGTVMYVWHTTWDTERDAREFHAAYCLALEKKYGQLPQGKVPPREDAVQFKGKDGTVHCERRGTDVLILDEASEAMLKQVAAIWDGAKKAEMTGFERVRKYVCRKDNVKEAFPGDCSTCGAKLTFDENEGKPAKKDK